MSKASRWSRGVIFALRLDRRSVRRCRCRKVEAGATVYGDYCSSCHGEQLRNTSGGVTFDLRRLRPEDRDRFLTAMLDGKGQMPPWRGVLEMEQIEAIWAYIRAIVDR